MRCAFRLAVAAVLALAACAAHALDRSQCKQYGGSSDCWMPYIGEWDYNVCGEIGTFLSYQKAICTAQGGTWTFSNTCDGLPPPELRRPVTEGDMQPFAIDIIKAWQGPFCEGPTADPYTWGAVFWSQNCWNQVNDPVYTQGYESRNTTTPFAVHGKKQTTECSTTESTWTYSGRRERPVQCGSAGGQDYAFAFTGGGTPALCSLGVFYYPINPKQDCMGCDSVQVGNPIDPNSGVKRLRELDYSGSGPHPLRFERVYNSRVFSMDGRQWRHNYAGHIENHDFGTLPVAAAHRPSGQVFLFKSVGDVYTPDTDIEDRITKLVDGGGALTGWQYYDAASDATELYDAAGKLLSITNRAGLSHTLEYSTGSTPPSIAPSPGHLIKVTDSFGRQLSFTYDMIGRLASMQDPAGQTYLYEATSQNHVKSVTYPDGKMRTYLYNETGHYSGSYYDGRLTGILDENNSRLSSYYYDGIGFATRTTLAGGADNYVTAKNGWPSNVTVTDPLGTVRTYSYASINGAYRNTAVTQPAASGTGTAQSTKSYDANGNVTIRRDFNGNRTNYTYDLSSNLETSRTEGLTSAGAVTSATRTIDTEWHPTFRLPTRITEKDSAGTVLRETAMSHDAAGNVLSRTITAGASSRAWTYSYNANGSVLTANGPRTDVSDITTYTYYANDDPDLGKRGNLHTVTNALGHVTEITAYNAHGQPLTIVDPNGLTTTLGYDERLRLTSRNAGGELTSYEYDGVGNLTKVTLPDGSFLSYTYDPAHRLTVITDALGNRISYTMDAMGNRTQEQVLDPLGALAQTQSRVFNSLNRLFQEIGAQNQTTQYAYDNQGNVTSIDGPLAGTVDVTANAYDALNRLIRVTDPASGQVNYGYNALDQLTSVSDPRSLATTYSYNGLGDPNQLVSPDTGTTTNTYDAAGNLLTQTDAKGQVTTYTYDALNRVGTITFHDGSRQTYTYDQGVNGIGRLTRIADTDPQSQLTGQIDYGYDQKGRVISDERAFDSWATLHKVTYQYDAFGRLSTITYPFGDGITSSGRVEYGYDDPQGRISQISTRKPTPTTTWRAITTRPSAGTFRAIRSAFGAA